MFFSNHTYFYVSGLIESCHEKNNWKSYSSYTEKLRYSKLPKRLPEARLKRKVNHTMHLCISLCLSDFWCYLKSSEIYIAIIHPLLKKSRNVHWFSRLTMAITKTISTYLHSYQICCGLCPTNILTICAAHFGNVIRQQGFIFSLLLLDNWMIVFLSSKIQSTRTVHKKWLGKVYPMKECLIAPWWATVPQSQCGS